jgi:hypothetical protein
VVHLNAHEPESKIKSDALIYSVDVSASVDEQLERCEVAFHYAAVEGRFVVHVSDVEVRTGGKHDIKCLYKIQY